MHTSRIRALTRASTKSTRGVPLVLLLALSACGSPDTPKYEPQILPWAYSYHGPGKYDGSLGEVAFPGTKPVSNNTGPTLSAEERAKYCAIYTDAEPDAAVKAKLISDLTATWKRDVTYELPPFGLTFKFAASTASLTGDIFFPDESIGFDKVYVSKPTSGGRYDGYRIVELPANNNAGVAAFSVKFMPGAHGRPNQALFLTARKYWRDGQTDQVLLPGAIFESASDTEDSVRLWVYPIKNP